MSNGLSIKFIIFTYQPVGAQKNRFIEMVSLNYPQHMLYLRKKNNYF